MIPHFWNKTVTVYTKFTDNGSTVWYRYVLHNCFYKSNKAVLFKDKTLYDNNKIMCRIPQNSLFMPYSQWAKLTADEKAKHICITTESIICFGEIETELEPNSSPNELIKQNECFRVNQFNINSDIEPKHYYASGA